MWLPVWFGQPNPNRLAIGVELTSREASILGFTTGVGFLLGV
jgi:hypothetical protein